MRRADMEATSVERGEAQAPRWLDAGQGGGRWEAKAQPRRDAANLAWPREPDAEATLWSIATDIGPASQRLSATQRAAIKNGVAEMGRLRALLRAHHAAAAERDDGYAATALGIETSNALRERQAV